MSKKEKHQSKTISTSKGTSSQSRNKLELFDRLNNWFEKNDKKVFYSFLFLSTIFSFILFDAKVSDGGDDSSYIERAWSLLHENKFPYFQGPGYPIFFIHGCKTIRSQCNCIKNVVSCLPLWICLVYV